MAETKRPYDSTLARMAGNIAAGLVGRGRSYDTSALAVTREAIAIAKAIVQQLTTEQAEAEAGNRQ